MKMGLFHNGQDATYQLLSEPNRQTRRWRCETQHWVICGSVTIIFFLAVISVIVIWDQISHMKSDTGDLDFVLFGPHKETSDMIRVSEYRTLMYALDSNNSTQHEAYPAPLLGKRRFDSFQHIQSNYSLVCYYVIPNRTAGWDQLFPKDMDANLCTHIIISFSVVHNSTVSLPSTYEAEIFRQVVGLKKQNPELKVMLSVISFSSITDTFGIMVSTQVNRKRFIASILGVMNLYNLDGVDIDWEFPAWPLTKDPRQKDLFVQLLKEMRTTFGKNYIISVAVAAPIAIVQHAYNISSMARYVDFVNVMCYDYHAFIWYLPFTGPNSPLYQSQSDIGYFATLNINYTVHYWIHEGMPKHKIMVGMPTYGHSWSLVYPAVHGYGALAKGFGSTGDKGFISSKDVCSFLTQKGVTVVFDGYSLVPYAFRENEWISYDNQESLAYKTELVTELALSGAMVYSLNQDDFTGKFCSNGKFPLISAIKKSLSDDNL